MQRQRRRKWCNATTVLMIGIAILSVQMIASVQNMVMRPAAAAPQDPWKNPVHPRVRMFLQREEAKYAALHRWVVEHSNILNPKLFYTPHMTPAEVNAAISNPDAWAVAEKAAEARGWHCRWDGGDVADCINPYHIIDKGNIGESMLPLFNGTVEHIVPIGPWTHNKRTFDTRVRRNLRAAADDTPLVGPQTLYDTYNIDPKKHLPGRIGVIEFQDYAHYCASDLKQYRDMWGFPHTPVDHVGEFNTGNCPEAEASLDIQMINAVAPYATGFDYFNTEAWIANGAYVVFNHTEGRPPANRTVVYSESYGACEHDQNQIVPSANSSFAYYKIAEAQRLKLVAIGVTIVDSTGDSGCHTRQDIDCSTPACCANYPASSKYSVGASGVDVLTNVTTQCAPNITCLGAAQHQRPCMSPNDGWTTAGAASNFSSVPPYQAESVARYNELGGMVPPFANTYGLYSADLSAPGHALLVVMAGSTSSLDGTSASAPIIAGQLYHLNSVFADTPRGSLGFANPLLYFVATNCPSCIRQVDVMGNNSWTEEADCKTGYQTLERGWNPVTGTGMMDVGNTIDFLTTARCSMK